jgi:hypothetical protein
MQEFDPWKPKREREREREREEKVEVGSVRRST